LAKEQKAGTMFNGIELKWSEPPEARKPSLLWRFHVFKNQEQQGSFFIEMW
jgi:hypothetical protein